MDDFTAFLHRMGVPAWAVAILSVAYIAMDKLKLWHRRGKSEREILSSDEMTFRRHLMERLESVESRLTECMSKHDDCQRNMQTLIHAAAAAGVKFAVDVSPVAPVPTMAELVKGDK